MLEFPLSFRRQYAGPLDEDSVFKTTAERMAYLSNARRYPGQPVVDLEEEMFYIINATATAYVPVGVGTATPDTEALTYADMVGADRTALQDGHKFFVWDASGDPFNEVKSWAYYRYDKENDAFTLLSKGDVTIDLSNYYTKVEVDDRFQAKEYGKGLSTNDYTDEDQQRVAQAVRLVDGTLTAPDGSEVVPFYLGEWKPMAYKAGWVVSTMGGTRFWRALQDFNSSTEPAQSSAYWKHMGDLELGVWDSTATYPADRTVKVLDGGRVKLYTRTSVAPGTNPSPLTDDGTHWVPTGNTDGYTREEADVRFLHVEGTPFQGAYPVYNATTGKTVWGIEGNENGYDTVYFVDVARGDDATAMPASVSNPWKSIKAAALAARGEFEAKGSRTLVYVARGVYHEWHINQDQVDMYFEEKAIVISSGEGYGCILTNDHLPEGITCRVYGKGEFYCSPSNAGGGIDAINFGTASYVYIEGKGADMVHIWGENDFTAEFRNMTILYGVSVYRNRKIRFYNCTFPTGVQDGVYLNQNNEVEYHQCEFIVQDITGPFRDIYDHNGTLVTTVEEVGAVQYDPAALTTLEAQGDTVDRSPHTNDYSAAISFIESQQNNWGDTHVGLKYRFFEPVVRIRRSKGVGIRCIINYNNDGMEFLVRNATVIDETPDRQSIALVQGKKPSVTTVLDFAVAGLHSNATILSHIPASYVSLGETYRDLIGLGLPEGDTSMRLLVQDTKGELKTVAYPSPDGGHADSVDWAGVQNKPAAFPPEAHRHGWSDLDNVPTEFAPSAHRHDWADLDNVPPASPSIRYVATIADRDAIPADQLHEGVQVVVYDNADSEANNGRYELVRDELGNLVWQSSMMFGLFNEISGRAAFATGYATHAMADYTTSEGWGTWANGRTSHAEGRNTVADGETAHSEGHLTEATGNVSHSQGFCTTASGDYAHTGGKGYNMSYRVKASGRASFNHSEVTGNSVGAAADNSAILGGVDNQVQGTALRSVVLGGQNINATEPDTVYVPNLRVLGSATDAAGNPIGGDVSLPPHDTLATPDTLVMRDSRGYAEMAELKVHGATTLGNTTVEGDVQARGLTTTAGITAQGKVVAPSMDLNLDMSLQPVTGGQSHIASWWGLVLNGNMQSDPRVAPSNIGATPDWPEDFKGRYGVVIPNNHTAAINLMIKRKAGQTGDMLQFHDENGNVLARFTAAGDLHVNNLTVAGSTSGGSTGGTTTVAWEDVTGKPTAFTPTAHRHDWTEIDNAPAVPQNLHDLQDVDFGATTPADGYSLEHSAGKWRLVYHAKKTPVRLTDATTVHLRPNENYNFVLQKAANDTTLVPSFFTDGDSYAVDVLGCNGTRITFGPTNWTHYLVDGGGQAVTGVTLPASGIVTLTCRFLQTEQICLWTMTEY